MNLIQILSVFGIPSVCAAFILYVVRKLHENAQKTKALEKGVQALLRAQMIADYNHYSEKRFAPIYAKENFENLWAQYHALGANGVMDDIHERFKALPTQKG